MAQTKKYLMFISYVGSGFRGSQIQTTKDSKNAIETVQGVVERGLKHIFELQGERPICVKLGSRTDKGVHALRAPLVVNLPIFRYEFISPKELVRLLNSYFFKSHFIRVLEAHIVPDSFTFHKVKKEKTYLYRVGFLKNEFFGENKNIVPIIEIDRTHFIRSGKIFELNKAQEAALLFQGIKNFGAIIGRPSKNILPTICNVKSFEVQESQTLFPSDPLTQRFFYYQFLCKGDRFLFHMVRRMVSLTIGVGLGLLNLKDIQKLFDEPYPSSWPKMGLYNVPGYGLYLADSRFDLEDFIQKEKLVENTINEVHMKNSDEEMVY